jgi:hypothetical protein
MHRFTTMTSGRVALATRFAVAGFGLLLFAAIPPRVAASSPLTDLGSSQNPSSACTTVTFTATVYGIIPPPLGGVIFLDGARVLGAEPLSPDWGDEYGIPVPTNHSSATLSTALGAGTHIITFAYDSDAGAGISDPLVQQVNAAESTTAVTSSVDPSVYGEPVTWSADVSNPCSASVTGTVQFRADGADIGGPQPVDGGGHASFTTADLSVGLHPVQAIFTSTDPDLQGSIGTLFQALVLPGQRVDPAATTTTVSSSADPSESGAAVTFTAATTVVAPGAGTVTGSVQFQDGGVNIAAPVSVDGSGHAAITTSTLGVGSHTIVAVFTSDSPDYTGSDGTITQNVDKARTTLRYNGPTSADYHDVANLAATLTRTDNGRSIAGRTIDFSMASEHCSAETDANGRATCPVTPIETAGPFIVSAVFAGDGDDLASNDSVAFQVTKEETTTTYTGPTVIAQGQPVSLSGQLLEDGAVPIAGRTLTLTLGSGGDSQSCVTPPTGGSGDASCTVSSVSVDQGPEPVEASFAGDGYYLTSADTQDAIVFAFPDRGVFVIGDRSAGIGSGVTFWSSQWFKDNSLSHGSGPSSFKGFAGDVSSAPPACGGTWTTSPGNSASPVDTVPAYMGVAVSSSINKHGNVISGDIVGIVVVKTSPGYAPDPRHAGTGIVVATYCW